jgi:hypothetical protein
VRESVPTAGRTVSPSAGAAVLGRHLGDFARLLERGRIAASLWARCPLGFNGVIIAIPTEQLPCQPPPCGWEPKGACALGDFTAQKRGAGFDASGSLS